MRNRWVVGGPWVSIMRRRMHGSTLNASFGCGVELRKAQIAFADLGHVDASKEMAQRGFPAHPIGFQVRQQVESDIRIIGLHEHSGSVRS